MNRLSCSVSRMMMMSSHIPARQINLSSALRARQPSHSIHSSFVAHNFLPSKVILSRSFATQANTTTTPQKPTLPAVLRKFYMVVHPDRFVDYPEARANNEQSMKDFLAYIKEYKNSPHGSALGQPRRIPLKFFVRDESTSTGLRLVESEVILNATNPHAAKRRLMSLFSKTGIESDFQLEADVWTPPDTENLRDFLSHSLPTARDIIGKASINTNTINQVIADIERRTRMKINMATGLASEYTSVSNKKTIDQFDTLMNQIATTLPLLQGLEVNFDTETSTSEMGAGYGLYLSRTETLQEWESFFKRHDWAKIQMEKNLSQKKHLEEERAQHKANEARIVREEKLAAQLGIRSLKSISFNTFECQYSADQPSKPLFSPEETEGTEGEIDVSKILGDFLDKLTDNKKVASFKNENQKIFKKLKGLEVHICPNMPVNMPYHLSTTGELRISALCTPEQFLKILLEQGPKAQELTRDQDKWETTRDFIEVKLGLSTMTADYTFAYAIPNATAKIRLALGRLQKIAENLRTHKLSGMTLAISDHYGLSPDGVVYIKWDFPDEDITYLLEGGVSQ
eukprot:TRINITY_DN4511_c0_g1_i1.p1 TRINITY_DN4511_c0_g1~~TRINITY_DN4511_c0_g1_i1.p1  ORF type:complete len:571 (+),score=97.83 TRINITY_DN4511_c0_g1_i1:72-1784(+)